MLLPFTLHFLCQELWRGECDITGIMNFAKRNNAPVERQPRPPPGRKYIRKRPTVSISHTVQTEKFFSFYEKVASSSGNDRQTLVENLKTKVVSPVYDQYSINFLNQLVSDEGKVMPPKSTWFEPKLLDGLISHVIS